ncbi:histidine ammonia-lyase [Glaciimonas sp. PAMC28666]|uniref:HAL/PAL/TAL family ammonia-lyase n=1 Tax=Glaciimonas sp. PAMC28666 TaxID=2807626 RepID=UPI00196464D9|nr:aromatic amino acid ammonia-lyase [Glaciimonas sp. PAMC28666]QRX83020.1 aromatic amino acid lyase [Glaciimonas sp. PAMC28666]
MTIPTDDLNAVSDTFTPDAPDAPDALLRSVCFDRAPLTIEDIVGIASGSARVELSTDPVFLAAITRGADFLDRLLREDGTIYGVTTGYGDSCTVNVPAELVAELPHHLYTYHGCGLGEHFTPAQTRAILAVRLASLSKGYSGVSVGLLEQITRLLKEDLLPLIPAEGSVGASGDLTPLSYLAAVLCGEREVWRDGVKVPAAEALAAVGMTPLRLRPKEGLAIMNGTAVMTALACLAYDRAEYLVRIATRITAMSSFALDGNAHHFDEALFAVKPHVGQQQVAAWLRQDLPAPEAPRNEQRLQDRYSIRCAPHVIGVLADALTWMRQSIENELNSANDNPIIDGENERVLHGGHFYGGHIAFAMDSMKNAVANVADLLDRQMALLVDSRYNHGLPPNLSGAEGPRASINHGLKALQISASAWTAEALKLTMPASVFSRSTECHNQDKVSMGTIAARDCLRVLQLTEQVIAALLISVRQGVWLRCRVDATAKPQENLEGMLEALAKDIEVIKEDRMLEPDLRLLLVRINSKAWDLYA